MTTYSLSDIIKDANGSIPYTDDLASMGTLDSKFYFKFSKATHIPEHWGTNIKNMISTHDQSQLFALNYNALLAASVKDTDAVFGASLRTRMALEGFTSLSTETRSIYIDEYTKEVDLNEEAIKRLVFPSDAPAIVKFVNTYFFSLVGTVAHVFRVRGHHYKDEYETLYERTWKSTTIEASFTMPTWRSIARDFLHCFGVRALGDTFARGLAQGELPHSLVLRANASCAGTAPIRTAAAAIEEMSHTTWYKHFYTAYKEHIEKLLHAAEELKMQGLKKHINAKLYNWNLEREIVDDKIAAPVVPFILGWLDTLDPNEPMTKQKCLNKRGVGAAALRQTLTQILINQQRDERTATSIKTFFKAITKSDGDDESERLL